MSEECEYHKGMKIKQILISADQWASWQNEQHRAVGKIKVLKERKKELKAEIKFLRKEGIGLIKSLKRSEEENKMNKEYKTAACEAFNLESERFSKENKELREENKELREENNKEMVEYKNQRAAAFDSESSQLFEKNRNLRWANATLSAKIQEYESNENEIKIEFLINNADWNKWKEQAEEGLTSEPCYGK